MKRLLVITTISGTLEAFLLPFADHFRGLGWRVDAMAQGATSSEICRGHFDSVFDASWNRNPLDPRNLSTAAGEVRSVVVAGDYDIVHVHTPVAAFATRFALRRRQKRPAVVYTAHGFHFFADQARLPHALFLALERLAGRWTDRLVVINREDESAALHYGLVPADHVTLMHGIGVDPSVYDPEQVSAEDVERLRSKLGVPPDVTILTMVAEFTPHKRHRLVLEALSRMHDQSIVLALAGDGPLLSSTKTLAEQLGVAHRVRFLGFCREIPVLLAASAATVLASKREGLPRSTMESLLMGIPAIGADIRGIRDLLDGGCGVLVTPDDADSLARAMGWVAANTDEARTMGLRGRQKMLRDYTIEAIIHEHEQLYAGMLGSKDL